MRRRGSTWPVGRDAPVAPTRRGAPVLRGSGFGTFDPPVRAPMGLESARGSGLGASQAQKTSLDHNPSTDIVFREQSLPEQCRFPKSSMISRGYQSLFCVVSNSVIGRTGSKAHLIHSTRAPPRDDVSRETSVQDPSPWPGLRSMFHVKRARVPALDPQTQVPALLRPSRDPPATQGPAGF